MKNNNQIQEKLRSIYFELISEIANHSYDQILSMITKKIKLLLNAPYAGIYVYDNWSKTYQLTTKQLNENKFLHKNLAAKNEGFSEIDIYQYVPDDTEANIISLSPERGCAGLLYVALEKQIPMDLVQIIRNETEKVLTIIHQCNQNNSMDKNNKFLLELSSRLLSTTNKRDILIDIINGLENLYPNLSYNLLLSQDTEPDPALPVKTIEYSDDVTKRVSTQAFISGKVQIENRVKEKNSCLYAPLNGKQGVYGILQVITPDGMDLPEQEIEFITQIAHTAGKAIENVTLYENSNHLVSDLKLINDATHKLNSNLKLSEITKHVRNQIIDVSHASQVGFIYYNDETDQNFDILSGSTTYFNTEQGRLFAEHLLKKEESKREPIFIGNYNGGELFPFRSLMVIPMSHSGTIHGLIAIMHEEAYFFTFDTFKLMQSLIQHSTLAFTNTLLKDKLEKAVITDFLTKLFSRNYLEEEINKHMDNDEMGALILFDIDDFKSINDTYGHHIGDEVLKQVAKVIMRFIESEDVPARWGGEELAIYAPNITINEGVQIAGLIRRQVEKFTEPMVTLSCGVSSWTRSIDDSVSELFIRADKALYEAKNTGKNSVVKNVKIK